MPAPIPDTIPEDESISATAGLVLIHIPPGVLLLSVVVLPWHTVGVPVIGVGNPTVTVVDSVHPAAEVKVIFVVPTVTPVTIPVV